MKLQKWKKYSKWKVWALDLSTKRCVALLKRHANKIWNKLIKKIKNKHTCGNTKLYFTFQRTAYQQHGKRKRKQAESLLCTKIDKFTNEVTEKNVLQNIYLHKSRIDKCKIGITKIINHNIISYSGNHIKTQVEKKYSELKTSCQVWR